MYPEHLTAPMRQELTTRGFEDLTDSSSVSDFVNKDGVSLLVINSVCGCAAGTARPGVLHSVLTGTKKPDNLGTVFAGVDQEAVAKAREFTMPYPPSSPSIAVFKDGELKHFVERHMIEGRSAEIISNHLQGVYEEVCA